LKTIALSICTYGKNNGVGGHYYSLLSYAQQLKKFARVIIINIGNGGARAFEDIDYDIINVISKDLSIADLRGEARSKLRQLNADIVQCFDIESYFFVRRLGPKRGLKVIVTRCGGPDLLYFPRAANIICFSQENLDYFYGSSRHRKANLILIPNRVPELTKDDLRIQKLKKHIGIEESTFLILRIVRIGRYYEKSTGDFLRAVDTLASTGKNVRGLLIGKVEDQASLEKIKAQSKYSTIVTREDFYVDARELIPIADMVMGAGRSLMEAAYFGLPLLVPSSTNAVPVLLDQSTFTGSFRANFSERYQSHLTDQSALNRIVNLMESSQSRIGYRSFITKKFREYFDINLIEKSYKDQLAQLRAEGWAPLDFALHYSYVLRRFWKARKR
jgi:hypothetical protein